MSAEKFLQAADMLSNFCVASFLRYSRTLSVRSVTQNFRALNFRRTGRASVGA
jgi:hypothetical protein